MLIPESEVTSLCACVLINAKSVALVKSSDLSASLAVASISLAAFVLTTSTTEFSAAEKAAASLAPAPSAAEANAVTTLMTCWLTFSTASALATSAGSFSSTLNGLKLRGSTPAGNPKTSAT